jgi:glycerophosphoryl diester phosphodiesterase
MIIISHRGYWIKPEEKNSMQSFINSIKLGFGCETDIRDYRSELVISHDISGKNSTGINSFLELFKNESLLIAINIKADGLQTLLQESLNRYNITKYFVFDMSIPETKKYISLGFNVFGRQSEFEQSIPFYDKVTGVWLDTFEKIWYTEDTVNRHLQNGKQVCIVSSELHNRNYPEHWQNLKSWSIVQNDNLILCTDYPEAARKYFNI